MLATLAEVKLYLGNVPSADDNAITSIIEWVSAEFVSRAGREIEKDTDDRIEQFDGDGTHTAFLRKYPVKEFTSLERYFNGQWNVISENSYFLRFDNGVLNVDTSFVPGFGNYRATYKGGYDTVPADIRKAVVEYVSAIYNLRNSDGVRSETVNGDSVSFDSVKTPASFDSAVKRYKAYAFS